MAALLPAAFFTMLVLAFAGIGRHGMRQSLLYAAIAYTLCLVCATEALSVWNLLRFEALLGFWGGCAALAALCVRRFGDRATVGRALRRVRRVWAGSKFELGAVAAILAVVLVVALAAPPNNPESMAYRMMRVAMWMQQGSVAHFAAPFPQLLYYPPLSEWHILHLQILAGGDRFADAVGWAALAGCGALASLLARELKQPARVQVLAGVVAATLPMGLLQGSSSQSNLAVAFWLLAFVVLSFQFFDRPTIARLACCGLAFGFALLTKGTAYAIVPAVAAVLWLFGIVRARGARRRARLLGAGMAVALAAALVNGGHWARNWELSGNPLGPMRSEVSHLNERVDASVLLANLVRNSAQHWGVPSESVNRLTLRAVRRVFGALDDVPGSTMGPPLSTVGIRFSLEEGRTGNFLHFWLLAASLVGILAFRRRFAPGARTVCLALCVVAGAAVFCGLLRWEWLNARYHTPLFMLGAPCVAAFLGNLFPSAGSRPDPGRRSEERPPGLRSLRALAGVVRRRSRGLLSGACLLASLPWIVANQTSPLFSPIAASASPATDPSHLNLYLPVSIFAWSRERLYFAWGQSFGPDYVQAADFLAARNAREIGFHAPRRMAHYPVWALLKNRLGPEIRLEYVGVSNETEGLSAEGFAPPFVFSLSRPLGGARRVATLAGEAYHVVHSSAHATVLATTAGAEEVRAELAKVAVPGNLLPHLPSPDSPPLPADPSPPTGDLEVYLDPDRSRLVYVKDRCTPKPPLGTKPEPGPLLFLHVVPADADDLPRHRRGMEYDDLGFRFDDHRLDIRLDGRCVAVRHLPAYGIAGLRTGEYPGERRTGVTFILPSPDTAPPAP